MLLLLLLRLIARVIALKLRALHELTRIDAERGDEHVYHGHREHEIHDHIVEQVCRLVMPLIVDRIARFHQYHDANQYLCVTSDNRDR